MLAVPTPTSPKGPARHAHTRGRRGSRCTSKAGLVDLSDRPPPGPRPQDDPRLSERRAPAGRAQELLGRPAGGRRALVGSVYSMSAVTCFFFARPGSGTTIGDTASVMAPWAAYHWCHFSDSSGRTAAQSAHRVFGPHRHPDHPDARSISSCERVRRTVRRHRPPRVSRPDAGLPSCPSRSGAQRIRRPLQ